MSVADEIFAIFTPRGAEASGSKAESSQFPLLVWNVVGLLRRLWASRTRRPARVVDVTGGKGCRKKRMPNL
jgi:hypothetical protein